MQTSHKIAWYFFLLAVVVAVAMFSIGLKYIPASTDESIIALQAEYILNPPSDPEVRHSIHPKPLFWRFPLIFLAQPYLFPIEAYIAAIPQLVLPANAFGVRAVPFALSLGALWMSFLVMANFGRARDTWPGLLLLAVPSAYVLMMQFGYALPGYPSHLLFIALAIWLLQRYAGQPNAVWAGLCGLTCAAALAGQFMAAPLLLMCGALILVIGKGVQRIGHAALFGGLAACGWAPIWLAKKLYPGAHTAVSGTMPLPDAMERLWSPALHHVLPVACGIKPTVFPDNVRHIELWDGLTVAWPFLWMALMLLATLLLCAHVWNVRFRLSGDRKITAAVFIGLSLAAILLFIISRRSHSHTYRYLLNTAWAIPFIVGFIYSAAPWKWLRRVIALFAIGLAVVNAVAIGRIMKEWSQPGFAADEASFYDVGPALAYLEEKNINHVYAGYGLAYRLTYLSGGRIIAAQYYNERFYGWPLPFKSVVDQATNVAYVLAPRFAITAERFADDMDEMGVAMQAVPFGELTVFHDFKRSDVSSGDWLSPAGLRADAGVNASESHALIDGIYEERWRSRQAQQPGMWVSLQWDQPVLLSQIYMYYNFYHHDRARELDIYVREDGEWRSARLSVPRGMDAHEFDFGRPVYGNQFQRIEMVTPTMTDGLKIVIAGEEPLRDWTIGEIRLWGREIGSR